MDAVAFSVSSKLGPAGKGCVCHYHSAEELFEFEPNEIRDESSGCNCLQKVCDCAVRETARSGKIGLRQNMYHSGVLSINSAE